jgi:hypothetical protein
MCSQAYQFKIQQKQMYLDQMADILKKLDQEVPQGTNLGEEFLWDDVAVCISAFAYVFL